MESKIWDGVAIPVHVSYVKQNLNGYISVVDMLVLT
jgi:hypothetical protein